MTRRTVAVVLLFVSALLLTFPISSFAQELKEGMTQGQFALWLVKAIGASSKLPPAPGPEDAIKFLTQLGSVPEGGWKKNEVMSKEALISLLEDPKDGEGLSWEELVTKVRDYIQKIFDKRRLGVFRAQASGTASAPGV